MPLITLITTSRRRLPVDYTHTNHTKIMLYFCRSFDNPPAERDIADFFHYCDSFKVSMSRSAKPSAESRNDVRLITERRAFRRLFYSGGLFNCDFFSSRNLQHFLELISSIIILESEGGLYVLVR